MQSLNHYYAELIFMVLHFLWHFDIHSYFDFYPLTYARTYGTSIEKLF